jgi:hypothetical protein
MHANRSRARSKGQALVEFAIIIPVFLFLLMGIVDFGRVIWANTSLAAAAREAARYAIVHGGSSSADCPVGPPGPDSPSTTASTSCPYPSPSVQSIVDAATNAAMAGGSAVTVSVCYSNPGMAGCTGTNARGQTITVTITSTVNLITPALLGVSSFGVSGSSTMVINH